MAPPANRDRLPLWHSVYFRNEFRCSYYNTKLIRQGVLTWGQFQSLEDARLFNALPRTWKGVYNHGGRLLNKVRSQGEFDTPAVHTQNWTRAWLLQFYASQPGVRDPQTPEVWEQLAQAQLPPRAQDFARKALWHKLTVHASGTRGQALASARCAHKRRRSNTRWSNAPRSKQRRRLYSITMAR